MQTSTMATDTVTPAGFDRFFGAYLECAVWSTSAYDEDGNGGESLEGYDFSDKATETLREFALDFFNAQSEFWRAHGWSDEQAGHDFWLTRNGHGAGFWDRGMEGGRELTDASKSYGSQDLYLSDEGEIEAL